MKRHIIHIFLATFVLTLCACATMFNSKKTSGTIITRKPRNLVINKDTIENFSISNSFTVDRDKKPFTVTAFTDSLTKTENIKSKKSFAYWLNLYPNLHLWTSFYIDTKTRKRYTCPKTVFVDLATRDSAYITSKRLDKPYDKNSNILKITPFKIVGYSNASIELSYERRTGRIFSTQLMASYLLPTSLIYFGNDFKPNFKGFRVSIEEKLYFKRSAPLGLYLSFEFDYLNNQYKDIWNFGEMNIDLWDPTYNNTNYPDTFGIKKQTYSFNLKLGYQLIVKRLSFDFYAGLGFRHKDVRHFDRINPNDEMEAPHSPNMFYTTNFEGKYWTISIPLNARIGWTF